MTPRVLACAIAFNERAKIVRVVERAAEAPIPGVTTFMVCDDGSTDGTPDAVRRFAASSTTRVPKGTTWW
jgi:glycosyltransferase involved in cell wall biosynthesis